ncbi:DUF2971 domain-containing protein [Streptomyces sp. NPDC127172]|uniref:DUF2971 domain-containing protein n=1 Tax=Streptomyces sp. NPDC127172 TaxID=3345382 RepID=UPI0036376249
MRRHEKDFKRRLNTSLEFPLDWLKDDLITSRAHGSQPPDEDHPSVLYHYTTTAGISSILSSQKLWVTDVEFLNDSQELSYAGSRLMRILDVEVEHLAALVGVEHGYYDNPKVTGELYSRMDLRERWGRHKQPDPREAEHALGALQRVRRSLYQMDELLPSTPLHVYVACFCEEGDLLSQWRGYGGAGGYSVGFNRGALRGVTEGHSRGEFMKICYDFRDAVEFFASEFFPEYLHRGITLMDDYLKPLTMIKNPAFREEREWRIMVPREEILDDVKFRAGPIGVTPYIEIQFAPEAVSDVIVGPGNSSNERMSGIRQLLDRHHMEHVDVQPSKASLRLS